MSSEKFQKILNQAIWAITYGPRMQDDERRRTIKRNDGTNYVLPYDHISLALHKEIGWPEKAR